DAGSAKILEMLGYEAIATTSSGHAATLGRLDGGVSREEALAHAATLVAAVSLPVSADLEHGFSDDAAGVAETISLALSTGLAGCSIEDSTGNAEEPIFEKGRALERVEAAVEAARRGGGTFVLTARAENYLHGRSDLSDTISRLQAFEEAGADVLYAPGMKDLAEIRELVVSVGLPVNVLVRPGGPIVAELAEIGVRRISVGGAFAYAGFGALVEAATEFRDSGTYGVSVLAGEGSAAARGAFGP
ncbi:MAG: isocitrate lyase/PEP mutase family protein, partial [Acidimicrobiales bacterium]